MTLVTANVDGWPAVIERVLERDRRCIFADMGPIIRLGVSAIRGLPEHWCRGRYGEPIPWWKARGSIRELHRAGAVELDHVKEQPSVGAPIVKRLDKHSYKAPDDEAHLVVACHGAHHGGLATSHEGREFERAWLAAIYPDVWASWIERQAAAQTPSAPSETGL